MNFSYRFSDRQEIGTVLISCGWRLTQTFSSHSHLYGNVRAVDISEYLWKYVQRKLRFNGGLINCIVREFAIPGWRMADSRPRSSHGWTEGRRARHWPACQLFIWGPLPPLRNASSYLCSLSFSLLYLLLRLVFQQISATLLMLQCTFLTRL